MMKLVTLSDREHVVLVWALQLATAAMVESPYSNRSLLEELMLLRQLIDHQCGHINIENITYPNKE